jgi:hypothetical protein
MTGVRAVGRLPWAAIATGLVLAGCGSAAAPTVLPSHAASRRGPANPPNASAVPNGAQRCTEVYCVLQAVPRGPANRPAPNALAVPNGAQRCTEVYCVLQAVPRGPANGPAPKAAAVPNGAQRCTEVYCVPRRPRAYPATFAATG